MNRLDDDLLRDLLADAAERFELPANAVPTILAKAVSPRHEVREPTDVEGRPRRPARRVRVLTAASAVLVGCIATASLLSFGTTPPRRAVPSTLHVAAGVAQSNELSFGSSYGLPAATNDSEKAAVTGTGLYSDMYSPTTVVSKGSAGPVAPTMVVSVGAVALTVPGTRLTNVVASLTGIVTRDGGYVASSRVLGGTRAPSAGVITLRVPQPRFGSLVTAVEREGHVTSVTTNSTNVTGQYVDYESRISALKVSRQQYLTIMSRATTISDILAIQAQVNQIESQIEQLEGQRNLLVNQAAYATLTVAVNQHPVTAAHVSGLRRSWSASISGFVSGVEWLVRAAGPALFAILCLAVVGLLARFAWHAAQRRMI